tara:strand:+ start:107 stop:565 length:459 start_codon:yes stop_codon:yes gene_type:complete
MRSDYLNSNSQVSNLDLKIIKVTADTTLTADQSGSVVLCNPTATTEIDLPALSDIQSGWNCKIVLTEDTFSGDTTMNQKVNIDFGSGNAICGIVHGTDAGGSDIAVSGDDFINCTAAATPGDRFDIFTDGTNWYVNGLVHDASECAFNTAAG